MVRGTLPMPIELGVGTLAFLSGKRATAKTTAVVKKGPILRKTIALPITTENIPKPSLSGSSVLPRKEIASTT